MIRALNLTKRFGAIQAVNGVEFEARDGQITGLLGPNGAGKTTTMRLIYGLTKPDSGEVLVDGLSPSLAPNQVRARLGVVPDTRGLYPRLTAREHVRYFAQLQGLPRATLEQRVLQVIADLKMEPLADRPVYGFSQGERAKVAIARALVHDPQNLLLDEPTNGLDVMATRQMREVIRGFKQDGRCVVFSSHIMQEVAELCDYVVVISGGKVVMSGEPSELVRRTQSSSLEEAFVRAIGHEEGLG